jgi:hypothetical protein
MGVRALRLAGKPILPEYFAPCQSCSSNMQALFFAGIVIAAGALEFCYNGYWQDHLR